MLKAAANVCAVLLVLTYFSEQCYSLEIHYEHVENNELSDDEGDLFSSDAIKYGGQFYEESVTEKPKQQKYGVFELLFDGKLYQGLIEDNKIEVGSKNDEVEDMQAAVKRRVVRQAYPGQANMYPKLPSNSPYQLQPYPNNNNLNPQWQPPNNGSQHGYSQWQPHNNNSQQGYPSNGVSNFYPSTQQNSTYGHNPYNGQSPYYNNYPTPASNLGYRPPNSTVYNSGQNRPPYNQYVQSNNNTYPGYPQKTPVYNPTQRPPYYSTTPSNRPPYYNHQNTSNWPGNNGQNARSPYNPQNGQNPQYFNPNNPYGQPNNTYGQPNNPYGQPTLSHNGPSNGPYHNPSNGGQYPAHNNNNAGPYGQNLNPYNNPSNSQYAGTNYPGNSYGSSYPTQPQYGGSVPGQRNYQYPPGSNGTAHDPTRVSPEHFSYPN